MGVASIDRAVGGRFTNPGWGTPTAAGVKSGPFDPPPGRTYNPFGWENRRQDTEGVDK